jgi:hypothetical protein
MLLILMTMTIQLAEPPVTPPLAVPDSALRDPYGFILSHCSPLVRRTGESLEACENRVGEAVRARLPTFRPRPAATTVASASDDPASAVTGTTFGGRCTTRQDSRQGADGSSSSSSSVVCGDTSSSASRVLEGLLAPR